MKTVSCSWNASPFMTSFINHSKDKDNCGPDCFPKHLIWFSQPCKPKCVFPSEELPETERGAITWGDLTQGCGPKPTPQTFHSTTLFTLLPRWKQEVTGENNHFYRKRSSSCPHCLFRVWLPYFMPSWRSLERVPGCGHADHMPPGQQLSARVPPHTGVWENV